MQLQPPSSFGDPKQSRPVHRFCAWNVGPHRRRALLSTVWRADSKRAGGRRQAGADKFWTSSCRAGH
ncbi:MAG: hypothetical protein Q8P67_08015 [archaeon]|nr:hypothetical protein [archaeon]